MNSYNGFTGSQRAKAAAWLRAQWARGRPRPSTCSACGQTEGVIDAHAEDYSEPFGDHTDAHPLCYRCHLMLHCRFANDVAWREYVAAVKSGKRFAPCHSRSFGHIRSHLAGREVPFTQHEPPGPSVFDLLCREWETRAMSAI